MVLVKDRKLSFGERCYVKSIVAGLLYTFSNLFKRKVTRCYPEQKLAPGPSFHGVPVLVMDANGHPKCVACGLCEYVCPARAIRIVATETERPIERTPKTFEINMLRCIECGYCEESCPEEAIVLSQQYELVASTRGEMRWDLNRLLTPEAALGPRLGYIRKTFHRFEADPRSEGTARAVPGKGGSGAGASGAKVASALERYRDGY